MTDSTTDVLCYYRVSTLEQGRSGLGLAAQRKTCRDFARGREDWKLRHLPEDIASAKSTNGRHNLLAALDALDRGEADILLVAKLDRISRSTLDFAGMVQRALKNGWSIAVAEFNFDMSQPIGRCFASMMMALAEYEREMIAERTKVALAQIPRDRTHTAADGTEKLPPGKPRQIDQETAGLIQYMRSQGKSFRAVCAELTAMGKPTPGGGPWRVSTIQRILAR